METKSFSSVIWLSLQKVFFYKMNELHLSLEKSNQNYQKHKWIKKFKRGMFISIEINATV